MSVAPVLYTVDEYFAMPEDGNRYEVLNGELVLSPSPHFRHNLVANRLNVLLATYVWTRQLGQVVTAPQDVVLSPYTVVQPDVLFLATRQLDLIQDGRIVGAPDLVIEVLSRRTMAHDLVRKAASYADAGVPEYWTVDLTRRTVTIRALVAGRYEAAAEAADVARSLVLPGFAVNLDQLFQDVAASDGE